MPPDGETPETIGVAVAASLSAPPESPAEDIEAPPVDAVRQSPEFRQLQEQNRQLARQNGQLRGEAERVRSQQEADRQAAEAQRVEAMRQEMVNALGEDASSFSEFAQLLQSDPVAAARRFAELRSAQSVAAASSLPGTPQPQEASVPIPPATPGLGVQANVPLGANTLEQTRDAEVERLMAGYESVVKDNRNLGTRARVTARRRADGIVNFLRAGYVRDHAVDPEPRLRQR